MIEVVFAIPGDLTSRTGGYCYARRLLADLPKRGVAVTYLALPDSFPDPTLEDMGKAQALLQSTPPDACLLVDGLALGALPPEFVKSLKRKWVALAHHPLGLETGLSPERSQALCENERAVLAHVSHIIVTSTTTHDTLVRDFSVPASKIAIAEPGMDAARRASGSAEGTMLVAVGAVTPRKGFDVLVAALADLSHIPWRLRLAGSLERAPQTAAALVRQIGESGLAARIELLGELDDPDALDRVYAGGDIFVSPSHYEGYGMALAEAMARGMPIVASTGGAAGQTVPDAAALKVPPGDEGSLREALLRLLTDRRLRARLAQASWSAGQDLAGWQDTIERVARALRRAAA